MKKESISPQTFVKGLAAGAVVAASLGVLQFTEYSTVKRGGDYDFVPGTYTASAKGMESDVIVTITVDETSITDVSVDVSGETDGIGAAIGDTVTAQIMDMQSPEIDGVAGATVSSTAVRTALEEAIAKAQAGDTSVPESAAKAEETEAVSEAADSSQSQTAPSGNYTPGTYTATAKGIESDVKVEATFDESSLTALTVDVSGETAGLGAEIGDEMIDKFLQAQSPDVDAHAGATVTSDALKAAMADVFAQADAGGAAADDAASESSGAAADTGAPAGSYTPGTYSASAQGIESEVKVEATFDETSLTDLTVDVSGETAGLGADIGEEMVSKFLEAQSADVDAHTGATVTSDALKTAVADVFAQASAGAEDAAATEEVTEAAAETEPATEAAEAEAPASASTSSAASDWEDGIWLASAPGLESDVTVCLSIQDGKITSAGVNATGETPEVGGAAAETLAKEILAAQSAQIDAVAGATITSNAAIQAAEEALALAAGTQAAPAAKEDTAAKTETEAAKEDTSAEGETEAAEEDTSVETEAEGTEEAVAGALSDGQYQATAPGIEGDDVGVALTVKDGRITAVGVDVSKETPEIGGMYGPDLAKAIFAAQGAEIDTIAGATVTSQAAIDATKAALAQAAGEEGSSDAATGDAKENTEAEAETEAEETAAEAETEAAEEDTSVETEAEGTEEATAGALSDGQYQATAPGIEGDDVGVALTVKDGRITAVGVDVYKETPEIGGMYGPDLAKAFFAAQGAEIDPIAGATVTSQAAIDAAKAALAQAAGEAAPTQEATAEEVSETEAAGTEAAETEAPETEAVETEAPETEGAETEAPETEIPVEEATEEMLSAAPAAAFVEEDSATYPGTPSPTALKDGTYTATAQGLESTVGVALTVRDGRIVSVGINVSGETEDLGAATGDPLSAAILAAQGAEVDTVAGATITSEAVMEAAAAALELAAQ